MPVVINEFEALGEAPSDSVNEAVGTSPHVAERARRRRLRQSAARQLRMRRN